MDVDEIVISLVRSLLDEQVVEGERLTSISTHTRLGDLPLDSLEVVSLVVELEEVLDTDIAPGTFESIGDDTRIEDIVRAFTQSAS